MGDRCELFLEKSMYCPGDVINGMVECTFIHENKVTEIRVNILGRAKVRWQRGRATESDKEEYFNMVNNLLTCETKFSPGTYNYPFTFNLPDYVPSSVDGKYGKVEYKIQAVIDRPWAFNYECKKMILILSYNNLSMMKQLHQPMEYAVERTPFTLCSKSKPIQLSINLLRNGFTPGQLVVFSAKLRNNSNVRVNKISFKIIQGFEFHISTSTRTDDSTIGQEFTIADSTVLPGLEYYWDLELKVPENVFIGTLQNCQLINVVCKLRVKVFLPMPHTNFKIDIPLVLGSW